MLYPYLFTLISLNFCLTSSFLHLLSLNFSFTSFISCSLFSPSPPLQVHNSDGVWLRLSPESMRQYCIAAHSEAWCLQYNQHLGKTLLVPLDHPKTILDQVVKRSIFVYFSISFLLLVSYLLLYNWPFPKLVEWHLRNRQNAGIHFSTKRIRCITSKNILLLLHFVISLFWFASHILS